MNVFCHEFQDSVKILNPVKFCQCSKLLGIEILHIFSLQVSDWTGGTYQDKRYLGN